MKKSIFSAVLLSGLLLLASCATTKVKPYETAESNRTQVVNVSEGMVRGVYNQDRTVELFAGIPYAAPPVGDLRWKEPQPAASWNGILDCDTFPSIAWQKKDGWFFKILFNSYTHQQPSRTDSAEMSEDCLYLNIWRPADAKSGDKLPVLVYIHGGSLMTGSSWYEKYDGENLCKDNIIVVTIAYRLGVFGYFASEELAAESPNHTTGNYGLLDQVQALKWINENIEAFGGDKSNMTIAGESAGSSSVNALCCSPLSKGLFKNAIGESSSLVVPVPAHTFRTRDAALKMGKDIMQEFKVSSVEELRKIPAEKLIKTKYQNNALTTDEYSMPESPWILYSKGLNHEKALLNGFNTREANAFTFFSKITLKNYESVWMRKSPFIANPGALAEYGHPKNNREAKDFYSDVFSAICFTYPHKSWSDVVTAQGRPVYEYYFSKENGQIGTNHSGEMIYAYRNVPENQYYDEKDFELERIMSSYWVNFVKTGNPNGEGLPEWKTVKESNGLVLELGEKVEMVEDPFTPIYQHITYDVAD